MGVFGTDYSLRPGHLLFFILSATSIILGFNYVREMNQRIQFQQDIMIRERQRQHDIVERSNTQRKATQLQTQLQNTNKEMSSFKEMKEFQIEQLNENFRREKIDLLQTISSKDYKMIEVQNQYESLKQQFEHLSSVLRQFERNQSRLLEKFSTQSTQCMDVINMMSELCKKGKELHKTEAFNRHNATEVTVQSENSASPHTEDTVKGNIKPGTEHILAPQTTGESHLIDIQDLHSMGYEGKNPTGIGDDDADDTAQEKIYSQEREKELTSLKAVYESIAGAKPTINTNVTFLISETAIVKSGNKQSKLTVTHDAQALEYEANNTISDGYEEETDITLEKINSQEGKTAVTSQKRKDEHDDDMAKQKSISMLHKTNYTITHQPSEAIAPSPSDKQNSQGTEDNQEGDTEDEEILSPEDDKMLTPQQQEPQDDENDEKTIETLLVKEASPIANNNTALKQIKMDPRTNTEQLPDLVLNLDSDTVIKSTDEKGYFRNFSEVKALIKDSLQKASKDIRVTNGNIFVKEDVTNDAKTNITLSTDKNLKEEFRGEALKVKENPQKWPLEKIKTAKDIYKTQEKRIYKNIWEENDKEDKENMLALKILK